MIAWFGNRRMRTKLLTLTVILCIGALSVGLLALSRLSDVNGFARGIYDSNLIPAGQLANIRTDLGIVDSAIGFVVISSDAEAQKRYVDKADTARQELDGELAAYQAGATPGTQAEIVQKFADAWSAYKQLYDQKLMQEATKIGDSNYESVYLDEAAPLLDDARGALRQLAAYELSDAETASDQGQQTYSRSKTWPRRRRRPPATSAA